MEEMSDEADQFDILGLVPYDKPLKVSDLAKMGILSLLHQLEMDAVKGFEVRVRIRN